MAFKIAVSGETGLTLYATLQQVTSAGVLGDYWNVTASAFQANPSLADRKLTLTEGTGSLAGSYSGGTNTALSTYTGFIRVRIHDANLGDQAISVSDRRVTNGSEDAASVTTDLSGVPAAVQAYLAANPVPASNMRGTDNAMLAASYTAPDNAGIATAITQSTGANTQATAAAADAHASMLAAQSVDAKLPSDTSTKINRLDAAITTRSSHTPADVRTELNSNPVPASNMRGTDNAMLAASYTAPDNTSIGTAATNSTAAKTASETVQSRLTATRAGYLDNLSAGPVATQAQVSAITNTTRSKFIAPAEVQIPTSGSTQVLVTLILFDANGNLNDADSTPSLSAKNASGTDRSVNLGAVSHPSTGKYEAFYTISSAHLQELINITATWAEGAVPSLDVVTMSVSNVLSGGGFTSTDRTSLTNISNKLPSRAYLAGTDASDGDIDLDNLTGDRTSFMANVSALATSTQLTAVQTHGDATWATATGFVLTTDSRLNYLDAAISSRSTFAPGAAVALQTDVTALQTHGDLAWATATGFVTTSDARINRLDVAVSTRSAFDYTTNTVTLTAGHGLATQATALQIKAKTDLIPTDPVDLGDIPTAGEIAVAVDAAVTASHGSGDYTAGGGDATLAKQDQILAQIAAMTPTPVAATDVADSRTWVLTSTGEGAVAQNIVTISSTESVTLAVDFTNELNPQASITTVTSVTVIEGASLTTTNLLPNGRRTHAHFYVSGASAGVRKLDVKVTASDGDVSVGHVTLEVV